MMFWFDSNESFPYSYDQVRIALSPWRRGLPPACTRRLPTTYPVPTEFDALAKPPHRRRSTIAVFVEIQRNTALPPLLAGKTVCLARRIVF